MQLNVIIFSSVYIVSNLLCIVPEGVEYIRKQGGVYEIYYPPKTSLVPRPLFFLFVWGRRKKGLVDLQYIFCAAGSTTFGG